MRRIMLPMWFVTLAVTAPSCAGPLEPEPDPDPEVDGGAACDPGPFTSGVSTLAGCDEYGAVDGERGVARFHNPVNVARGPDGRLYVADFDNGRIRIVDDSGTVSTLVEREGFARPFGLAFAPDGTLYVSTDDNPDGQHGSMTGTIWAVDPAGDATVIVRDIGRPRGLLALDDGRIVVSDYQHDTLRLLTPGTATLVGLAGAFDQRGASDGVGAEARFAAPVGLARLADGRIAVADVLNHRLRAVALDGTVTTIAGTGEAGLVDGDAATARFAGPQGLAADAAGHLYITDTDNFVVRRLAVGAVTTIVGSGAPASHDDDALREAAIFGLEGIAVADDGSRLWIADGSRGEELPHHRVRMSELPP